MKAIATLRSFTTYLRDKGKNVQHLVDAVDEIEAYIHALEYHQQTENKHRILLAKLLIRYHFRLEHALADITCMSLPMVAHEFASLNTDLHQENMNIYDQMVSNNAAAIELAALSQADELAEISL